MLPTTAEHVYEPMHIKVHSGKHDIYVSIEVTMVTATILYVNVGFLFNKLFC